MYSQWCQPSPAASGTRSDHWSGWFAAGRYVSAVVVTALYGCRAVGVGARYGAIAGGGDGAGAQYGTIASGGDGAGDGGV